MPINEQQEREVTFISGVGVNGLVAPISYYTLTYLPGELLVVPAEYRSVGDPIKWGDRTPGQAGGTVTYWFDGASGWTNTERAVWAGSFAFWSGIANITFQLAGNAADANITVVRGSDKKAHANFHSSAEVPVGSATVVQAPERGAIISVDTSVASYGPINLNSGTESGYVWSTLIHEVGHIVGLGHGGPYNFTVNPEQQQFGAYDSTLWSVMSYLSPSDPSTRYYGDYATYAQWLDLGTDPLGVPYQPLSPQMLDILAAQRLYGASTNDTFDGDETYGFNSTFTDDYFGKNLQLHQKPGGHRHDLEPRHQQHARPVGLHAERRCRPDARHLLERRRQHQQHRHRLRHRRRDRGGRQRQRHDPGLRRRLLPAGRPRQRRADRRSGRRRADGRRRQRPRAGPGRRRHAERRRRRGRPAGRPGRGHADGRRRPRRAERRRGHRHAERQRAQRLVPVRGRREQRRHRQRLLGPGRRERLPAVLRLRLGGRHLHPGRRHPLADHLGRRHDPGRDHHRQRRRDHGRRLRLLCGLHRARERHLHGLLELAQQRRRPAEQRRADHGAGRAQRRAGARPRQRSDGAAVGQLGDAPEAACRAQRERCAVDHLRCRCQQVRPGGE